MDFRRGWLTAEYVKTAADGAPADTLADTYFFRLPVKAEEVAVHVVPNGALTADDTNYATVTVKKADGAGGSTSAIASKTTKLAASGGSGDWVAGVPVALAISADPAKELAAGNVLAVNIAKAGSGVVVPACAVVVTFKPRRKR